MYTRLVFSDFRQGLAAEARGFNLASSQARAALGAALAAVSATLLADALNLERSYWSGITALVVSRATYAASLTKGALRIVGTIAGCVLALILVGLCINNNFAMLCLLFFSSAGAVLAGAVRGRDAYAFSMCGFMAALIALAAFSDPNGVFDFAFYRTFEIGLGSVVAVAVSALVNPVASSGVAAARLGEAWTCLARGFELAVPGPGAFSAVGSDRADKARRLGRHVESLTASLPQLIFEGLAEGGFGPEQTALASRLCRSAAETGQRMFLVFDRLNRLERLGYSPGAPYAAELDEAAARLFDVAAAVEPALTGKDRSAFAALPVAPLERAVDALLERHQALLKAGGLESRSGEEALVWSEFLRLASDLSLTLGNLAEADAGAGGPGKKAILESIVVRQALSAGLALVLIPLIWKWFYFPGATQIGVTALIALQADPVETWRKGFLRLSGCLVGGGLGLFLLGTPVAHSLVPWTLAYFGLLFLFSYIDHGDSRCSYLGLQAGIALTVTLVQDMGPAVNLEPPVVRLCSILTGVLLLNVIHSLLGGYSPLRDLRDHIRRFLSDLAGMMTGAYDTKAPVVETALAEASASLKAARRAQDILVWQGELDARDGAEFQDMLTDAERVLSNARAALTRPGDPDARMLLSSQVSRMSSLRGAVGESLWRALKRGVSPWSDVRGLLRNLDEDFESDAAAMRRLARERTLPQQARMEAAAAVMALKGLLEALASMAGRAEAACLFGETPMRMRTKE